MEEFLVLGQPVRHPITEPDTVPCPPTVTRVVMTRDEVYGYRAAHRMIRTGFAGNLPAALVPPWMVGWLPPVPFRKGQAAYDEFLASPLSAALAFALKRWEGVDVFDVETSLHPFLVD